MRRALLWFLPAGVGVVMAGVFAAGFAAGMSGRLGVPAAQAILPTPTPAAAPAPGGVFRIVALGDSLTRGAGDGAGGYPERVVRAFRQRERPTAAENLAVDGSETGDVLRKVKEPGLASVIARADLILLSAGGNDLTHALRRIGPDGGEPTAALDEARRIASANLRAILAAIRAANPSAPIRLLGLYAPSGDAGAAQRIEREGLLRMQTPQGFERDLIWRHLREAKGALLDDAEAVLSCGVPIATVPGEAMNLKVTTQDDLLLAEIIARGLGGLCPPTEARLE